ncbi:MAG: hypothetical protein WCQ45_02955 [bacterium]
MRASRACGIVALLLCLTLGAGRVGAADGVGALFRLGVSARSLGVGGATAAFSDGAAAATLNPAALGWVRQMGIASLYVDQFGGVSYGALAFSAPYVGMAATFVDSGWIASDASGFRFTAQGLVGAVGIPLGPVSAGARWRFLRSATPFAGHGWALDAALLLDLGAMRIGAVWDAVASSPMTYDGGEAEAWDSDLRVGAALTLSPFEGVTWTVTADVSGVLYAPLRVVGGVEAWVGALAARLGWDGQGPTFGLSVRVSGIEVDWSFTARPDLRTSHRVSLEVLF